MSVIRFKCGEDKKEEIETKLWDILKEHYFNSVGPNSNVDFEDEGDDVYLERLNEVMEDELCFYLDYPEGVEFEFDTTEDAGFAIAENVYKTGMGYSDNNLTWVPNIMNKIVDELPGIPFEAEIEASDNWGYAEGTYTYDGETLETDIEEYIEG